MQDSASITFERIRHTSALEPWEIVLAILLFAGLIYFAIWRSCRQSKKPGSLNLGGR
jgi:hypothetical protein